MTVMSEQAKDLDRSPGRDPDRDPVETVSDVSIGARWTGGTVRPLPPAARALDVAVTGAVLAARDHDETALDRWCARAGQLDTDKLRKLLAHVVRALVEESHPTGVSSEDLGGLVSRSLESAAPWTSALRAPAMLAVLTGAFGVHPDPGDDGQPAAQPSEADILAAAAILTADLLDRRGRELRPYLAAAFTELAREETLEMP